MTYSPQIYKSKITFCGFSINHNTVFVTTSFYNDLNFWSKHLLKDFPKFTRPFLKVTWVSLDKNGLFKL
jgi:hypothetical protein